MTVHDRGEAISRVALEIEKSRSVTFVLGSGLTMPTIPGAAGVIERALAHYGAQESWFEHLEQPTAPGARYRILMEKLRATKGTDTTKKLMQDCILDAFHGDEQASLQSDLRSRLSAPLAIDQIDGLMARYDEWSLSPAAAALGRLLAMTTSPPIRILTTNFDPMIQLAARRHEVTLDRVSLQSGALGDANPDTAITERPQVVFLHGTWTDYMRHTAEEIAEVRPIITDWIYHRLRRDLVVVGGYGGWHDSFSQALRRATRDRSVELCWTGRSESSLPVEGPLGELIRSVSGQFYARCELDHLLNGISSELGNVGGVATVKNIADSHNIDDALTSLQRRHGFGYSTVAKADAPHE